jgi:DNA-binding GntR family transcriptional regulator
VNAIEPAREPGVAVVDVLRDAIRQRLLAPGAPLVQASLASALGVSKIPVREALHSLAAEGLVTFTEEGVRVASPSPAEVHELWSLRALIEPALAGAIVRNAGPADVRALGELVAAMDAETDGDAWSDLNFVFHLELYRIAALPHYAAVARRVLTLIEPHSRVAVHRLAGRDAAQSEHRELLLAIEARDEERLRATLEVHATRARELLMGFAERERDPATGVTAAAQAARSFAARLTPPPAAPG